MERKPQGEPGPSRRGVGEQSVSLSLSAAIALSHWYFCRGTMNSVKFLPQMVLEQELEEVFLTRRVSAAKCNVIRVTYPADVCKLELN